MHWSDLLKTSLLCKGQINNWNEWRTHNQIAAHTVKNVASHEHDSVLRPMFLLNDFIQHKSGPEISIHFSLNDDTILLKKATEQGISRHGKEVWCARFVNEPFVGLGFGVWPFVEMTQCKANSTNVQPQIQGERTFYSQIWAQRMSFVKRIATGAALFW